MSGRARGAARPGRFGLVLGAGGVLGAAWTTGALAALQARLPRPVGEADVVVGTSAGTSRRGHPGGWDLRASWCGPCARQARCIRG
jgi:hypothetical protein